MEMDSKSIDAFYSLAEKYCAFITKTEISGESVPALMELLMSLYISAQNLPDMEPETTDASSFRNDVSIQIRIHEQISPFYWETPDPFVREEPVCGCLADDLADIASDLQRGMREYNSENRGNAVFEWKFGLRSHWGSHAADVLRVLHSIRRDETNRL